ncbi:hypothetical protein V6767_20360 [Martelella sp. FLE1502]
MTNIKATIEKPTGFSDPQYYEYHVTIVGFVNTSTPDTSRRHGNHSGTHAICVMENGLIEEYPISQIRVKQ